MTDAKPNSPNLPTHEAPSSGQSPRPVRRHSTLQTLLASVRGVAPLVIFFLVMIAVEWSHPSNLMPPVWSIAGSASCIVILIGGSYLAHVRADRIRGASGLLCPNCEYQ